MKKIPILIILLLTPSVGLSNTCNRSNLDGIWTIYTTINLKDHTSVAARCALTMLYKGSQIIDSSSYCDAPNAEDLQNINDRDTLSGNLFLGPGCHISGKITTHGIVQRLDGYIGKDKSSMSGILWSLDGQDYGSTFTAIKQSSNTPM